MRPLGEALLLTVGRAVLVAFVGFLLFTALMASAPTVVCQL
jgi:hypothetical protein